LAHPTEWARWALRELPFSLDQVRRIIAIALITAELSSKELADLPPPRAAIFGR
jgi:hypothetical protein